MAYKRSLDSKSKEKHVATGRNKSCNSSSSSVRASFDDIPYEIILNILSRLPVKSVFRCRCVCKTWYNICDDPSFGKMHMLNFVGVEDKHDLVVVDSPKKYGSKKTRLFSLKKDCNILRTSEHPIAELVNSSVKRLSTINLGIIIFEYKDQSFLLNPFSGEVLMLPPVNSPRTTDSFGLGFDKTTKVYKVVRVLMQYVKTHPPGYVAEVYTLGTKSWRQISPVFPKISSVFSYRVRHEMPISAYGDIHWMLYDWITEGSVESMIISFDCTEEEFKLTPHPEFGCKEYKYFFLVDLRGSLAILNLSPIIHMEIWVLKDYARKEWAQEYAIRIAAGHLQHFSYHCFVGAWEEGLLFRVQDKSTFFYCDLKTGLSKYIYCNSPTDAEYHSSIFSYRRSLVSLTNHGNLMRKDVGTGNCFDLTAADMNSLLHSLKI